MSYIDVINGDKKRHALLWFLIYFMCTLIAGVLFRDIQGQPNLFASINNFMASGGLSLSDPSSFAIGAKDIFNNGSFSEENRWLINLWPPGFMYLEGVILKVFGLDAPFIFILLLINSFFLALVFLMLRETLKRSFSVRLASILPIIFLFFPLFRFFLLQPIGLVLGEGLSIICFLLGSTLIILSCQKRNWLYAVTAGLCFGGSTYFRSQFEIILIFLSIVFIFLFVVVILHRWFCSYCLTHKRNPSLSNLKMIFITLAISHSIMMPWRMHNANAPYEPTMSWVKTASLVYLNASRTDKELHEAGGGWLVEGKENLACKIEPSYCGNPSKEGFYSAFIFNAKDWMIEKFSVVGKYWFSPLIDFTVKHHSSSFLDTIANLFFLIAIFANFILLWLIRRTPNFTVYLWLLGSFYACYFVVFTLVHFEVRYFYTVKIFSIFLCLMLYSIYFEKNKEAYEV